MLHLKYENLDTSLNYDEFWADKSGEFDKNNYHHVLFMTKCVKNILDLDGYDTKRLEIFIKTELPAFAIKRIIAKNYIVNNFNQ